MLVPMWYPHDNLGIDRSRVEHQEIPMHAPSPSLVVREHNGQPFYEAKFRHGSRQVKRRIGPAWVERDQHGWRKRHGRVPDGAFDERRAYAAAASIAATYIAQAEDEHRRARERELRGITFRELAAAYITWLRDIKGAKPATLRDHGYILAEPGTPYKRGKGQLLGHVMRALGDMPAAKITTRDIDKLLQTVAATGVSPRAVNKTRNIIAAAFNYGMRGSAFGLPSNPGLTADVRREPHPGVLLYYSPAEVEAIADALADGRRRTSATNRTADQIALDGQDAELVRTAAYTGLRLGELLALRWRDVDFTSSVLTISRALSAGIETTTKSGRVRRVPLPTQASDALRRLARRTDFTAPAEFVFVDTVGRPLNSVTVRKRFKQARDAIGARALRFHDLRHTYGSLLAASGVDLVTIKETMGHSALSTTGRYLHARPASEQAATFTKAFATAGDPS
jgi:integrase